MLILRKFWTCHSMFLEKWTCWKKKKLHRWVKKIKKNEQKKNKKNEQKKKGGDQKIGQNFLKINADMWHADVILQTATCQKLMNKKNKIIRGKKKGHPGMFSFFGHAGSMFLACLHALKKTLIILEMVYYVKINNHIIIFLWLIIKIFRMVIYTIF